MPLDTQVSPVHIINRYVYDVLRENMGIIRANYGGKTPIIPAQQVPEFNVFNRPYLVYGFSEDATRDLYAMRSGTVAYAIYSADDRDIIKIINILTTTFGRLDDSAADLNNYKSGIPPFADIKFTSVGVGLVEGPGPAETEGGRQSGVFTARFSYFPHYTVNTKPAVT